MSNTDTYASESARPEVVLESSLFATDGETGTIQVVDAAGTVAAASPGAEDLPLVLDPVRPASRGPGAASTPARSATTGSTNAARPPRPEP